MAGWADARVGDADREAAAALLREHYAAGRLTLEEFQERLQAVYAAQVYGDLALLTADLPLTGVPGPGPASDQALRSLRRRLGRVALAMLAVSAAFVTALVLLAVWVPHGVLLAVLAGLLLVPVLLVTALAGAVAWIGRRAWRSGAWLEAVPVAAGMPWLGRVVWAARAVLAGRAFWRAGQRARRPLRARRYRRASALYQDEPGGPWRQARVGGTGWTPS